MDDVLYDALIDLKSSIDKQNDLQDQTNNLLRALIPALEALAQEILDLRQQNGDKAVR